MLLKSEVLTTDLSPFFICESGDSPVSLHLCRGLLALLRDHFRASLFFCSCVFIGPERHSKAQFDFYEDYVFLLKVSQNGSYGP